MGKFDDSDVAHVAAMLAIAVASLKSAEGQQHLFAVTKQMLAIAVSKAGGEVRITEREFCDLANAPQLDILWSKMDLCYILSTKSEEAWPCPRTSELS